MVFFVCMFFGVWGFFYFVLLFFWGEGLIDHGDRLFLAVQLIREREKEREREVGR